MKKLVLLFLVSFQFLNAQNVKLYVGTFTNDQSKGIYSYNFNEKTGILTTKKLEAKAENPSYLAISSDKKNLYAVNSVQIFKNQQSGYISSFAILKNELKLLNQISSNGSNPCHIQINKKNNLASISNYNGGTASIHKIAKDGALNAAYQVIDLHNNKGKSLAHSSKFYKKNLFIANLGNNTFFEYTKTKKDSFLLKKKYTIKNNGGPRHFEITKNGKFIYIINELNSTITVLQKRKHSYTIIQNTSTLPLNFMDKNACADIHLSKNEQFLYASNRGDNSIAVFKIDKKDGFISKIQSISTHGNWPRNFTLSPNGKFLLVANKLSNNISVYTVDKKSGKLSFLNSTNCPTPVCLLFK